MFTRNLDNNPSLSSGEHLTKSLHDNHEEEMRERVFLAGALGATKETLQATINQNREAGREDTSRHPFPQFSTKAKTFQ
jgi:hypothetical protein